MYIDYKLLGSRIKKARMKLNLRQEDLAEKCDLSNEYISKIENGIIKPSLETLAKICFNLDVSIAFIIDGTNTKEKNYYNKEVNEKFKSYTPVLIDVITRVADTLSPYFDKIEDVK